MGVYLSSTLSAVLLSAASDTLQLQATYLSHAPNKRVWQTSKNYVLNSEVYTLNNEVCLTTGVYGIP